MFELYLITFNTARNLVNPTTLAPTLFDALPSSAPVPDLVAVSLQEISPIAYSFLGGSYLTPYFGRVTATVQLAAKLRTNNESNTTLQHVATRSLGMTALMIFATPQFAERIQWIQSAGAGVGLWNMGNKGAVAMRLGVSSSSSESGSDGREVLSLTFAAAHLAPMESNIEARNNDWEALVRNLVFSNSEDDESGYTSAETQPLLGPSRSNAPPDGTGLFGVENDALFVFGDLNYRTRDAPPGADAHITYPSPTAPAAHSSEHFAELLESDQLTRERFAFRTLHHLQELPVTFPPTYKLEHQDGRDGEEGDSGSWDWAKHRYPSWCDRILYLDSSRKKRLEPQTYTALSVQATSDHRPVALAVGVKDEVLQRGERERIGGDVQVKTPFPINPYWRRRRDIARLLEVLVGVASYLALTKKGNAMLVAVVVGAAGTGLWLGGLWSER
jgi:hypothetical protein